VKHKTQKKEVILEAAQKCFRRYGFTKTTFKDIAKIAGVSRPLLYSYFHDKNDIFIALTKAQHDQYVAKSRDVLNTSLLDKDKLLKIIDVWIIDSYRIFKNTAHANEFLDGLVNISEQSEKRSRKLFIKSIEPLVGEEIAEIIVFSIRGLMDDRPPVKTLQKRIELLTRTVA
jgi:AcrR family transcriptional regulator